MQVIDLAATLDRIRRVISPASALRLPDRLPAPRCGCGALLMFRGLVDGFQVFECCRCQTPHLGATQPIPLVRVQVGAAGEATTEVAQPAGVRRSRTNSRRLATQAASE